MGSIMLVAAIIMILAKHLFFYSQEETINRNFLIFTGVLLVSIFGMRNGVVNYGTDLNNYYRLFCRAIEADSFSSFSADVTYETGYLIINWIISRVIKWPQIILWFQAIVCIGITLRFIYKHSSDVLFSVLVFMSFGIMQFYLTGFRQSIAICICLIALEMAENKRFFIFICLVVLASTIHQTAIVFIIAYVFAQIPTNNITIVADIIMAAILGQIVPKLIFVGNDVFQKNYVGMFQGNSTGGLINIVIELFILLIMYFQYHLQYNSRENDKVEAHHQLVEIGRKNINFKFMHILVIGTVFYTLRFQALVLERISFYFTPVMIILLPQVIDNGFTLKSRECLRIAFILGMLFLIYWRMRGIEYIPMWR